MTRINQSTNLLACLLAAIAYTPTNAKPIASRDQAWNEEEAESLKHLALEGSKFLQELTHNTDDASHVSRSDDESNKINEKAAIIGGTIISGIILGIAIFLGVLIYKRCIASRRAENKEHQAKSSQRDSMPETMSDGTYRDTWRDTFNHRVPTPGTPDSDSVRSERSFGTMSTDGQASSFAPGKWPKIVVNGCESLGVNQKNHIDPSVAIGCHQVQSPLDPKPLQLPTTYKGPFATESPSTTIEMTLGQPNRESGASVGTMSTLGRDLLQDTMQPPAPAKYSLFPKCEPLTETPHALTTLPVRNMQPRPAVKDNSKKPGRMLSRRYFVPMFKRNGQLQSPTSPEESIGMETVARDESRANMFSLGENKI
ncbi:uncharacterized protein NECHADRAFT_77976 [Fusarium vanettenii 77-13-4]|uniref:Mid2 domain-containing protein n=1 Tax=Fusarium vanettenii (strain ATCC MYA-4622 / CBS 123669 / FGSC 9596 / NRRL 45880 / 77-13-4) TaxID=660122 RepID=C7YMS2_FUSV7|nr:uncharacterized protein NECHADRAFT_77976 [Fusarium vanettenii 77-13-4]EEU47001.1 hypothetical protein NECHADRAFT_77976 [Fusarium vanettenii 77-13-4]